MRVTGTEMVNDASIANVGTSITGYIVVFIFCLGLNDVKASNRGVCYCSADPFAQCSHFLARLKTRMIGGERV